MSFLKDPSLLDEIYEDMLDVLASGVPTGSTELLADRLRKYLGKPEWPQIHLSGGGKDPNEPRYSKRDVEALIAIGNALARERNTRYVAVQPDYEAGVVDESTSKFCRCTKPKLYLDSVVCEHCGNPAQVSI